MLLKKKKKLLCGVIIKDTGTDWETFTQQVVIMTKVKELPKVLRDNFIKQHSKEKQSHSKDLKRPFK